MAKEKLRLDVLMKKRGLVSSRAKGQALIMAGSVLVDGNVVTKSGYPVSLDQKIEIRQELCPFVGRGGIKLQKALESFNIDVKSRVCMDVGASTGGFTDCLLRYGARLIYAIDVGYGQLDWQLRNRPDIINLEKTNIRFVTRDIFDEVPDLATIDISFISLKIVMPRVKELLQDEADIIALIKPQFEAGRHKVGKGGIIRDPAVHEQVLDELERFFADVVGLSPHGIIPSPIKGAKGNKEFLIHLKKHCL